MVPQLLSLTTPTGKVAAESAEAGADGPEGRAESALGRIIGVALRMVPSTGSRIMAAIVLVTPFSGSVSELHSRGGLGWHTAVPLGLAVGLVFWAAVIGVAVALRHRPVGEPTRRQGFGH